MAKQKEMYLTETKQSAQRTGQLKPGRFFSDSIRFCKLLAGYFELELFDHRRSGGEAAGKQTETSYERDLTMP